MVTATYCGINRRVKNYILRDITLGIEADMTLETG